MSFLTTKTESTVASRVEFLQDVAASTKSDLLLFSIALLLRGHMNDAYQKFSVL